MSIKFSAEKIMSIPFVADPVNYFEPGGCGCAWGVAAIARLDKPLLEEINDHGSLTSVDRGNIVCQFPKVAEILDLAEAWLMKRHLDSLYVYQEYDSNRKVGVWKENFAKRYIEELMPLTEKSQLKEWMLKELDKLGVLDTSPALCTKS